MKRYVKSSIDTELYENAKTYYYNHDRNIFDLVDYLKRTLNLGLDEVRRIADDIEAEDFKNSPFYDVDKTDPSKNGVCTVRSGITPPAARKAKVSSVDIQYQHPDGHIEYFGCVTNGYYNCDAYEYTLLDGWYAYLTKDIMNHKVDFDGTTMTGNAQKFSDKKKAIQYMVNLCMNERDVTEVVYEK